MSLYAIGDLHLHYQSQLRAPGQLTEKVWKKYLALCEAEGDVPEAPAL
jgi:hypothetical protein